MTVGIAPIYRSNLHTAASPGAESPIYRGEMNTTGVVGRLSREGQTDKTAAQHLDRRSCEE
jgi:hypothetical protein